MLSPNYTSRISVCVWGERGFFGEHGFIDSIVFLFFYAHYFFSIVCVCVVLLGLIFKHFLDAQQSCLDSLTESE